MLEKISDTKIRKELYDFNQMAKNIYNFYLYMDGVIVPDSLDNIKTLKLFKNSLFVRNAEHYSFMNNCLIDPIMLNKALQDKCYSSKYDGIDSILYGDKSSYTIGVQLSEFQKENSKLNPGVQLLKKLDINNYINEYLLNNQDKESLLNYETISLVIGKFKKDDIILILTKSLVPALKKANDIVIYSKPYITQHSSNIFDILIVSKADTWTFYSNHKIINVL